MPAKTKLAQLIARREGYGIPGTRPTRDKNPGDLEHGNRIHSWDGKIGIEHSDDDGWADLEHQLQLYASRKMTIRQMVSIYAPPNENDTQEYLEFITEALAVTPDTLVSVALEVPASA